MSNPSGAWCAARALLVLLGLLPAAACSPAHDRPELWGNLEPGRFAVGFETVTHSVAAADPAADDTEPVELEINRWFPAAPPPDDALRLRLDDYLIAGRRPAAGAQLIERSAWLSTAVTGNANNVPTERAKGFLSAPMKAYRNARGSEGPYPLVLWVPRHDTVIAQSVISEYLASHGYVVATVERVRPRLPLPWAISGAQERAQTFAAHLADLERTADQLASRPEVDGSRTAVLTWSYSAELAPRFQIRSDAVRLVIGLSSNPLSSGGLYQRREAGDVLVPGTLDATYVVMTERIGADGQRRTPSDFLSTLPRTTYHLAFETLSHGNFNALEGMIPAVFGIDIVQPWSSTGPGAQAGYERICEATLWFLDQLLQPAAQPADAGDGPQQLAAPGLLTLTRHGPPDPA